jgi:hypothetical protein
MQPTRIAILLAALLAASHPARVHAQPATPPAPAAPGDAARSQLMDVYQEYCLDRFPNRDRLIATIAERQFPPAPKADADRALKNRTGQAWVVAKPAGKFLLALWDTPQRGCAVTGTAPDDASTRATFDLIVTMYAGDHELGALGRPPVRPGQIDGTPATLQVIGADPGGQPREAFVNVAIAHPDGTEARLAREWGPPEPPAPAPSLPQSKP